MDMDLAGDSPADGDKTYAGEKIPIVVEVCMRSTSTARQDDVRESGRARRRTNLLHEVGLGAEDASPFVAPGQVRAAVLV